MVTGKLVARDLKERLGVGSDGVRTNANADAWSVNAPFTDEQHAHVEAEADLFYTDFVQRVAEGRDLTVEAVDEVARGRVWTGADALAHGLVDELGGLRTAVRRAKVLVGLDAGRRGQDRSTTRVRPCGRCCGPSRRRSRRRHRCRRPSAGCSCDRRSGSSIRRSVRLTGANVLWLGEARFD